MYALFKDGRKFGHESDDYEYIIRQALNYGAIYNVWNNNGTIEYSTYEGYTIEEVKE